MGIPEELKAYPQWVTYRGVEDKAPRQINDEPASSTDAKTWTTWDNIENLDNKGFVLTVNDPFVFWDFDKCLDNDFNITDPAIKKIVEKLNSYTEISPSKKGLHVLCKGKLPNVGGNRKGKIEIYDKARYTTMTGDILPGYPDTIEERQSMVNSIHKVLFKDRYVELEEPQHVTPTEGAPLTDDMVLEKLFTEKEGEKWRLLFHGDTSAYDGDDSRADAALMHKLAFYTQGDRGQMENLFRQSGLYRQKFEKRDDYRNGLINDALRHVTEYYTPPKKREEIDPVIITERFQFKPMTELIQNPPPPREYIMYPIIPKKSITLISGETGAGKTMFCMGLADHLGKGQNFGVWECSTPQKVCMIDGEMPIEELHQRAVQMNLNDNVIYYSKDEVWNKDRMSDGDMTDEVWQIKMLFSLMEQEVKVVIIDNISSLAPGIDEVSKKDWDMINQWLLSLRHAGITVIIVHHMGKAKEGQRGTSARIDNVDTVIEINFAEAFNPDIDECKFKIKFSKFRSKVPKGQGYLSKRIITYSENGDGEYTWGFQIQSIETEDSAIQKANIMAKLINGMTQTAIANELKLAKQTINKKIAWMREQGYLDGNVATERGEQWMQYQLGREVNEENGPNILNVM